MISFKAFVEAIHNAIISANDHIATRHEDIIDKYFEPAEPTRESAEKGHESHSTLRPKSICIQYPHQETDGMLRMIDIDVPLITLIPVSMPQIEEVKMTAQFDLQLINNEVQINFSPSTKKRWSLFGRSSDKDVHLNTGQLEITLKPSEGPEGLKQVIEGYEKVLRAQLPH